jgi:hypothetical protein
MSLKKLAPLCTRNVPIYDGCQSKHISIHSRSYRKGQGICRFAFAAWVLLPEFCPNQATFSVALWLLIEAAAPLA